MTKEKFLNGLNWFFRSFIWLFLLLLVIDIITKNVIMANLQEGESITLIPGFLWITYVKNTNAAFGMGFASPEVNRWIFIVVALIGTAIILYFYIKKFKILPMYIKACMMLILTGAIGNLIDRLFYAQSNFAVVDWINFFDASWWHWVFNIADSAVVIGAIMLIIWLIVDEVKDSRKKSLEAKNDPNYGKPVLSEEEKRRLEERESVKNEEKSEEKSEETESK